MGNPKAFITISRKEAGYRPVLERVTDFEEVEQALSQEERKVQASRCMDCGIPFCHWACPLGNRMPEWQDMIYKGKWKEGVEILHETNNFPDFTGRVCPAPCEKSCVLALHEAPVKKVAVVGSGPAGLAIAQQLNRKGHAVTVFEKDKNPGGLLRYGIPNFKLDKKVIDRRLRQLEEEGIVFRTNTEIGKDISGEEVTKRFDAVCLAIGAGKPRDINPVGRELKGIYFAMDFLSQQNQLILGEPLTHTERISARDRHVLVIGGGDTGSDCVGTSIRQGAVKVTQIEILPKPPVGKNSSTPWPHSYPNILKTSSSHNEGCERRWLLNTIEFKGENGAVKEAVVEEINWQKAENGRLVMVGTGNTETIRADVVFLALGFVHPVHEGLLDELGVGYDVRGNVAVDRESRSSVANVFATGDAVMGASLVVKAIASGRKVAESIHQLLTREKD